MLKSTSDAATHVQDAAVRLKDAATHVQAAATRLKDATTHIRDAATRLKDATTHIRDAATRLKDAMTSVQDDEAQRCSGEGQRFIFGNGCRSGRRGTGYLHHFSRGSGRSQSTLPTELTHRRSETAGTTAPYLSKVARFAIAQTLLSIAIVSARKRTFTTLAQGPIP